MSSAFQGAANGDAPLVLLLTLFFLIPASFYMSLDLEAACAQQCEEWEADRQRFIQSGLIKDWGEFVRMFKYIPCRDILSGSTEDLYAVYVSCVLPT